MRETKPTQKASKADASALLLTLADSVFVAAKSARFFLLR